MSVQFQCPACTQLIVLEESRSADTVQCPNCSTIYSSASETCPRCGIHTNEKNEIAILREKIQLLEAELQEREKKLIEEIDTEFPDTEPVLTVKEIFSGDEPFKEYELSYNYSLEDEDIMDNELIDEVLKSSRASFPHPPICSMTVPEKLNASALQVPPREKLPTERELMKEMG
jgi:predicted RNA-binding Zn-ribbon protein involved in translation (DUF1610 family)